MKKFNLILILTFIPIFLFATENEFSGFPNINDWKLTVSEDVYEPENLWDYINGGADLYLSYGFQNLHLAEYENAEEIIVYAEIYRHNSSTNAYGIYTNERSTDFEFIELGDQAYIGSGLLNFVSGNCYVKLFSNDEGTEVNKALKLVGQSIVEEINQKSGLPKLFSVFPEEGKLSYTDKYFAKKFLGNDFLKNAYSIDYKEGYSLFLIEGSDKEDITKMVTSYLELTKQNIDLTQESDFVITDPYYGNIHVKIVNQYLLGKFNNDQENSAKTNLEKLCNNVKSLEK